MIGDFTPWPTPFRKRKKPLGWIEDKDGCHIWTGCRNSDGYASGWDGHAARGVHRIRYEREIGPIPAELELDHYVCSKGAQGCCNPHHCRPVTHFENMMRGSGGMGSTNAAKTCCPRGHELPVFKPGKGRTCRVCANAASREYWKGKKQNPVWLAKERARNRDRKRKKKEAAAQGK